MKLILSIATLLFIPGTSSAQESPPADNEQAAPTMHVADSQDGQGQASSSKPDAPKPKDDVGLTPCPEGEFRPCALLGGLPYVRDTSHLTQHDKSTWQALKNPYVATISAGLVISTVVEAEGTHACIEAGTCRNANPLYGSKPSRATLYSVAMPLDALTIYLMARAKRNGSGVGVMVIGMAVITARTYFGLDGFYRAKRIR